jgi:hypothetical protein
MFYLGYKKKKISDVLDIKDDEQPLSQREVST